MLTIWTHFDDYDLDVILALWYFVEIREQEMIVECRQHRTTLNNIFNNNNQHQRQSLAVGGVNNTNEFLFHSIDIFIFIIKNTQN